MKTNFGVRIGHPFHEQRNPLFADGLQLQAASTAVVRSWIPRPHFSILAWVCSVVSPKPTDRMTSRSAGHPNENAEHIDLNH